MAKPIPAYYAETSDFDIVFWRFEHGYYVGRTARDRYVLEKRAANVLDECPDTGYYLYGNGYFGKWCGTLIQEAVDEAAHFINSRETWQQAAEEEEDA